MDIAAAGVATQIAAQKNTFALSQIKQNAQAEQQVADVLVQAAEAGAQIAASNGRVNITV